MPKSNLNEKIIQSCPLCLKPSNSIIADQLRRGSGKVYYCASCEHGFLFNQQGLDSKKYYAEHYRQEYSHNAELISTNASELFDVYRNFQQDRLKSIEPFLNKQTRLLEVGASSGQFLVHIKEKVAKINAIELDVACCKYLNEVHGIAAESEYLENSSFASDNYDIVCAFQVMEHVSDPVSFLKSLKKVTSPGGSLFLEVPNLHDPLLSVWGLPNYRNFFFHSAHIHYFTEKSLHYVAERAGFSAKHIVTSFTQDYNLLNHLHWIMNDKPQPDCYIGLTKVNLPGICRELSHWLTQEMLALNDRYIQKLVEQKKTSNIMLRLENV